MIELRPIDFGWRFSDPKYNVLPSNVGIVIEPNDPSGAYRLAVVAWDSNAKTEARAETTFLVK